MRLVIRNYKEVLFSCDDSALKQFAIVADGFSVRNVKYLGFNHFPACRVVAASNGARIDVFTNAAMASVQNDEAIVFVEESAVPFERAVADLPDANWSKINSKSAEAAAANIAEATASFGTLNLANLVKRSDWKQLASIAKVRISGGRGK